MITPVIMESMLGYHPCSIGFLTCARDPGGGQCLAGSLTGAVASERVSEALKGIFLNESMRYFDDITDISVFTNIFLSICRILLREKKGLDEDSISCLLYTSRCV